MYVSHFESQVKFAIDAEAGYRCLNVLSGSLGIRSDRGCVVTQTLEDLKSSCELPSSGLPLLIHHPLSPLLLLFFISHRHGPPQRPGRPRRSLMRTQLGKKRHNVAAAAAAEDLKRPEVAAAGVGLLSLSTGLTLTSRTLLAFCMGPPRHRALASSALWPPRIMCRNCITTTCLC